MTATRTAAVEFRGTRPATEAITWGQRAIWTAIERIRPNDAYFNFVKTLPLANTDVDTVLAALGQVIERHEALHTRIVLVDGEPHQQVCAGGELTVEIDPGAATWRGQQIVGSRSERQRTRVTDSHRQRLAG